MFKTALDRAANYRHELLLADPPLHDDLYIVAFPKSGITWLSFMMANIHLKCSGLNVKASYFNIDSYIPDIHTTRRLKDNILTFPGFRVIKSHSEYNPFYRKIIYLARDPRDVMVSYYHFTTQLGYFKGDIPGFLRSKEFGVDAWRRHAKGWLEQTKASQGINFFRYEDMKREPGKVLDQIYGILGVQLPPDVLEHAVQRSSFNEMKKDEEYCTRLNLSAPKGFSFVRKGVVGGYKAELTEADDGYIEDKTGDLLPVLGYGADPERPLKKEAMAPSEK